MQKGLERRRPHRSMVLEHGVQPDYGNLIGIEACSNSLRLRHPMGDAAGAENLKCV
jgi:hypothetical protein